MRQHRSLLVLLVCVAVWTAAVAPTEAAYNYRCLNRETHNTSIKQFEQIKMRHPMPGCQGWRKFCHYALLMFPDRNNLNSDVFVLTADMQLCSGGLDHIKRALQNTDTLVSYSKLETNCSPRIVTEQLTRWLAKRYSFRGLAQCVDNLCLSSHVQLEDWQVDQRSYCIRFLDEEMFTLEDVEDN